MENINATNITARINVIEPVPNVDINYGPYDSTDIAQQTLNQYGVWDENAIGLTVGVWKDTTHKKVEEYQLVKNNSGNLELTLKQAEVTPGTTDYGVLTGKPSINDHELSSGNNTLASIGAASASALSTHTGDSKIHVPMTYGGTTTAITEFKIEGEKMTITVGSSEYSFRLTAWVDIPDYYVLYANIEETPQGFVLHSGGETINWSNVTVSQLLNLALTNEKNGFTIKTVKDETSTTQHGTVECDYAITPPGSLTYTSVLLLTRNSIQMPSYMYLVGSVQDRIVKDSSTDNFNSNLTKTNVEIPDNGTYKLMGYMSSGTISDTKIVINF